MPPLSRSLYAQAIDRIAAAGPRLVVVDVEFNGVGPDPAADRALLAAIADHGPIVLAVPDVGGGQQTTPAGRPDAAGVVPASDAIDTDEDGLLRRMMRVQVALPTLAVRAAGTLSQQPVPESWFPRNHAWIDWRGGPGSYRTVSMSDVVRGDVPATVLTGKIVLIGVTAPIAKDVIVTGASSSPMAGVEVHANALRTLLDGVPLRSVPRVIDVLVVLALVLAPVLLSWRFPVLRVLPASLALLVGFVVAALAAFGAGHVIAVVDPVLGLALSTVGCVAVETTVERRQEAALRDALRRFVRPARAAFFISYRRDQSTLVADMLHERLTLRFGGASVFMDLKDLQPGDQWPRRIQEAIRGCSVMLILIGPHWLAGYGDAATRRLDDPRDWVRREIETALAQGQTALVPVLFDDADMPAEGDLPSSLAALCGFNAFSLRTSSDVDDFVGSIRAGRMSTAGLAPRDPGLPTLAPVMSKE
jgi:CHASE2 domain-containing sensor protein